jgi:hypothetical protein
MVLRHWIPAFAGMTTLKMHETQNETFHILIMKLLSTDLPPLVKNNKITPEMLSSPHPALCATLSLMEKASFPIL